MSVEIMENDEHDKQELMRDHVVRQYCTVSNRALCENINPPPPPPNGDHHRIKAESNKHSYFLRAKAPRFMGFHVTDEDGEFKKPSPSNNKERIASPLLLPSRRGSQPDQEEEEEEEDLANCLVMLSNKSYALPSDKNDDVEIFKGKEVVEKGLFQCKACKKVFNSHQALGGHRASHKKVKGCFASKLNDDDDDNNIDDQDLIQEDHHEAFPPSDQPDAARPTRKRAKMHECSVCRRVFTSGQALGGHKRCHWLTTSTDNAFIPNFNDFQFDHQSQQICNKPIFTNNPQHDHDQHNPQLDLNLNLPPAPQHDQNHHHHDDDKFTTRYEGSTRLCLQQWGNHNKQKIESEAIENQSEEGCGMKLRKLSDLRDVNLDGGWLQMGIASTTEIMR